MNLRRIFDIRRWRWSRRRALDEIDEEFRFHIEQRTLDNEGAGMSTAEARRDAERRFGDLGRYRRLGERVLRGRARSRARASFFAEHLGDVRFGWRMLVKTPVLSFAAVLTIGLGIAGTTAVASQAYGLALRGLPFEDGDRLMRLSQRALEGGAPRDLRIHDYLSWKESRTPFDDLAAFLFAEVNLADDETGPGKYEAARVTANLFSEVNTEPHLGRAFHPDEDAGTASPTVILSHRVWQSRYGGDPSIVGRTVRVNGKSSEVIGVMPEGFLFPSHQDVWVPLGLDPVEIPRGRGPRLWVVGRLASGVSPSQAETRLAAISERLAAEYPDAVGGAGAVVRPYSRSFLPPETPGLILVEILAAIGVLLIACANVTNLLLARATVRAREMAIRTAIGARRSRVVRQLMIEATMITVLGALVGLALASVLLRGAGRLADAALTPYWVQFGFETPVLLATAGVTLFASLVAGIVPAVRASGVDLNRTLNDGSAWSSSRAVARFSTALVVTELAISCALLVGAGVMIKSVMNFRAFDPGFDTERVLTARVALGAGDYPDPQSGIDFHLRLLERLAALPDVEGVVVADELPGLGAFDYPFVVEGASYDSDDRYPTAYKASITPGFFSMFGVEVREGREFTDADRLGSLPVAIVNESFRRRYLPDGEMGTTRIRRGRSGSSSEWLTIVGVVPDLYVGDRELRGAAVNRLRPEQFYVPFAQSPSSGVRMALKTRGDPLALATPVREAVAELDPALPVTDLETMERALKNLSAFFVVMGWFFAACGAVALMMAAVGLYGVIAFTIGRRTKEMGIRMALGARRDDVVRLVLAKGMQQIGIGMAIGMILGAGLSRPLQLVAFRVDADDPSVYGAIVAVSLLTGFAACLVPALRASRVEVVRAVATD